MTIGRMLMLGGLLLANPPAAIAQEPKAEPAAESRPETKRVDPVVVTATKMETQAADLTTAVTVVTGEEIESKHYTTLGDVLRAAPGVEIQRSGSLGKRTIARIRGAGEGQIQVLIDGARVKSTTDGSFNLSDISPDLIERIEVVRGPQSTIYGADAIGGVIHIITKRGSGPPSGWVSVEAGNHSTHRERAAVTGSWKLLDYSFFGSAYESGGQFDNDDSEQQSFGGRLGVALPFGASVSVMGRYAKSSTDLPIDTSTPEIRFDPDSQQQTELWTLTGQLAQKAVPWWEHRLAAHWTRSNLGFQDAPNPSTTQRSFTKSQIDIERREVEWVHAFRPVSWNTLTVGAEYRHEGGTNVGNTSRFAARIFTTSAFAQDEVRILGRVILNGGVRYDDNSAFGDELTPRVGAAVLIPETGTKLRGGWGKGFRAPTLNDLFFPGFGNPELKPEKSESWEAGVDQSFWKNRVRLGATYFHNQFTDLIQFILTGSLFFPQNVAKARTEGLEVTAEADVLDWLMLFANYTYTDTEDESTGLPLRRFARHRWSFGANAEPIRGLSLFAQAYVVSSQFESVGIPRNSGYVRFDVGGDYRVVERRGAWPWLNIFARVENLLDAKITEVKNFQALGVTVIAGVKVGY
jgi:vitamin B12 transporter